MILVKVHHKKQQKEITQFWCVFGPRFYTPQNSKNLEPHGTLYVGVHHKKSTWLNYQCQLACFCDGLRSSSSQKINLVKLPMSTCRFLMVFVMGSTGFHHRNPLVFFMEALMSNLRYWPSQNGVYETLEASQKRSQQDDVVLRWSWVDFITKSSVPACSFKGQCMWMEICKKTMSKPLLLWLTPINLIRKLVWQKDLHFVMNHSFKWVLWFFSIQRSLAKGLLANSHGSIKIYPFRPKPCKHHT